MKLPWICRWFGHKFLSRTGGYIYESERCFRCGLTEQQIARYTLEKDN